VKPLCIDVANHLDSPTLLSPSLLAPHTVLQHRPPAAYGTFMSGDSYVRGMQISLTLPA
jgi:hypothetical protein